MGDSHMRLQARLMSQALRKLTSSISKSNCVIIFINQLREKIGMMFGNPETTTGGHKGVVFIKNAVDKFKPIIYTLGVVLAGFLVCWGLISLKVFLFN